MVGPFLGGVKVKSPSCISDPEQIVNMVLEAMDDNLIEEEGII